MRTIYRSFKESAEKHPGRPCVSWKEAGRWQSRSYGEFLEQVGRLAAGLAKIGLKPGERAAIMSANRPEWLASDLAINKLGAVSVPIHFTANLEYLGHVLEDSGSIILITSGEMFEKHGEAFRKHASLKKIVLLDEVPAAGDNTILLKDLLSADSTGLPPAEPAGAEGRELASIVYTSGTTGKPKGVRLTNENILINVESALKRITVTPEDKFLSFLPLSHVLERTAGSFIPVLTGAAIAYAESVKKLADNLKEVKPTVLICVPRIFERMEEKIKAGIKAKGALAQKLFYISLRNDSGALSKRFAGIIINRKIKAVFGGRLRFAVSGGASLNERIMRFFTNLGIVILEGYGLTETSPIVAVNDFEERLPGSVGRLLDWAEVKILPDKEILIRGKCVTAGYWGREESQSEIFTADGWFKTGDLGFLDKNNRLTIIGRRKEMIATTDGKKINPEKLEALLDLSPYIGQSLVIGHRQKFLGALIVPEPDSIKEKFGTGGVDMKKLIGEEVARINQKTMPHEQIKAFELLDRQFSIEAEELTPTLKVRRHVIEQKHHRLIEKMYS